MTKQRAPSRRDFLAAAGAGIVGLACGSKHLAVSQELPVDETLLYVGTYTGPGRSAGVYLVHMDRGSGRLRSVGSIDAGANPSFLAIHPNGRVLYAVNEVEQGTVTAFAIAGDSGG